MKLSLILGALWAIAAAATALLPMRRQYVPGLALLLAAPPLIVFIGWQTRWWVAALCLLAFISMFRHPLRYLVRRALGRPVSLPPELERRK